MTIRELAKELQVSTSTILHFCNKNNFDGYSKFKETLKKEITLQAVCPPMEDLQELFDFLQGQTQAPLRKNYCLHLMFLEKLIEVASQFKKRIVVC